MRKTIAAAAIFAAAFAAQPAFAQPYPDPRDEEIRENLPHPGEIAAVGETLGRVADALMDVDIGPVVDAIDPHARHDRRGRTLGEIAAHDDPYARERLQDDIAATTVGLGAMAHELAVLTPVLRRSLEEAVRRMEDAVDHRRRYD